MLSGVKSTRESLEFDFGGECYCDVNEFEALTTSMMSGEVDLEQLERAAGLYRGDFMGSFNIDDASEIFEQWMDQRSRVLRTRYHELLQVISVRALSLGRFNTAIDYLAQLLTIDPEATEVYGLLMVYYAATGQSSAA